VLNHLWQSTLFAVIAWLMTLMLRKNRAQTRYWIWLAASVKFLIPFSLLVGICNLVDWPSAPMITSTRLSAAVQQASEPFSADAPNLSLPTAPSPSNPMPELLTLVWAIGSAAIGLRWWLRWRRVSANVRSASSLQLPIDVEVRSSPAMLDPGVFGIFRPVLLLPEGIAEKLTPDQLRSIVAHEMCHIRRRDNLATAVHMVVEAVFWFHPLVWWLGSRLVEERERACDEDVLRAGSDAQTYAEGILKVCEIYLESPLECVSGVSGANLSKRIEEIMTNRVVKKLTFSRKALLAGVGMLAVAGPVLIGIGAQQMRAQSKTAPAFEVVSVKPFNGDSRTMRGPEFLPGGKFIAKAPLLVVIAAAYKVPFYGSTSRLSGGPNWIAFNTGSPESVFEIEATAPKGAVPDELSPAARAEKMRLMVQAMLADRFKLVIHRETKEMPIYTLVVGKGGPKLPKADVEEKDCPDTPASAPAADAVCHRFTGGRGRGLHARAVDMSDLVSFVESWTDRPLFDKTGIKGLYKIETEPFQPMELGSTAPAAGTKQDGVDLRDLPTLFTVFERLGLRMESQKGKVDIYVIDHVEKPTEN